MSGREEPRAALLLGGRSSPSLPPSICQGVVDGSEADLSALQMQHPTEGVSELGELVQFLLLSLPKLWAEEMVQGEPDPASSAHLQLPRKAGVGVLTPQLRDRLDLPHGLRLPACR